MQRDYQKAAHWIQRQNAKMGKNPIYHFVAAAIYGQLGDATAAECERQWILANVPGLLKDVRREPAMRVKAPGDQDHFLEGLERASFSVPEG